MARNTLILSTAGFDEYIAKLERLEVSLKPIVEDALTQAAETITDDTIDAMAKPNLPCGGKYSTGKTKESIAKNPRVKWSGPVAEIGVGFDYDKPGAGGYLITGTPKMQPDHELNRIYKSKRYMNAIKKDMADIFKDAIDDKMGG